MTVTSLTSAACVAALAVEDRKARDVVRIREVFAAFAEGVRARRRQRAKLVGEAILFGRGLVGGEGGVVAGVLRGEGFEHGVEGVLSRLQRVRHPRK